ncbi:MAG: hypothetical protein PHX22_08435 [Dysgonamonadaceae bacterium]|nr:hypothetical protein [Dysgonamonadaceae bacterium]
MFNKLALTTTICIAFILSFQQNCKAQEENSSINNRFILKNGELFLIYQDALYNNLTKEGDAWGKNIDGLKSFAFDPINKGVHYVINTKNEIQKKTGVDGNYVTIMNGLPPLILNNIIVNPLNGNQVYLGTQNGIYITKNAGFNWEYLGLNKNILAFQINPSIENKFLALTDDGLYSSSNKGGTWDRVDINLPKKVVGETGRTAIEKPIPIDLVKYCDGLNQRILVTSIDGIFISDDDGKSWDKVTKGLDTEIYNHKITSLYSHDSICYMGTDQAIYKSTNSGEAWVKIDLNNSSYNIGSIIGITDVNTGGLILNDNIGNIFYYRNDGIIISLNSGVLNHSIIHAIEAKYIDNKVKIFAVVKNDNFVDINRYGIYTSENNGLTWRKCLIYENPYYSNPRLYISPLNQEIWHFISNENQLYYSSDNGNNWNYIKEFCFMYGNDGIHDFVFDPVESNIKYVCAGVNESNLYRYDQQTDNRMNYQVNASKMILARDDNKKMFTNTLRISTDGGWNWKNLTENVVKISNTDRKGSITPIYFEGNDILIHLSRLGSVTSGYGDYFFILSNDLGETWETVKMFEDLIVYYVYVNPEDNKNIYMVMDDREAGDNITLKVVVSYDGANTWETIYKYQLTRDYNKFYDEDVIRNIKVIKNKNSNTIFMGSAKGLLRSNDNGNSWEKIGGIK